MSEIVWVYSRKCFVYCIWLSENCEELLFWFGCIAIICSESVLQIHFNRSTRKNLIVRLPLIRVLQLQLIVIVLVLLFFFRKNRMSTNGVMPQWTIKIDATINKIEANSVFQRRRKSLYSHSAYVFIKRDKTKKYSHCWRVK